ncbi:hypothetical protein BZG02_02100 [Labilibaculum filiforme]|uniref:Uncharacterized protein n=1 Tax=Labilibaculum filiforme TaxID=1940526 RepID=A0A2N3I679_9BACT|nr:hypothetical protein [Labilibaculum filiforme]PKQ65818.1 hypothetical protein BZG02_02100 [Labilibaculum filiforme]
METLKEYTTIASTELRKVIFGLIATVFGLAYKEQSFNLNGKTLLMIALICFFLYFIVDLFEYIKGAQMAYHFRDQKDITRTTLFFFSIKIFFGIIGLSLCFIHVLFFLLAV